MFAGSIQGACDTRGPEVQRVNHPSRPGRADKRAVPSAFSSGHVLAETHRNESASAQARGRARPRPARAPMPGCGLSRRRIRSWRLRGSGKRPLPEPPPGIVNVSLNPSDRQVQRPDPSGHGRYAPECHFMAHLLITGDVVTIHMSRGERFEAAHGDQTFPRSAISSVRTVA